MPHIAQKNISNEAHRKSVYFSMFTTVFIDLLGVGILIPVLPALIFSLYIPAGYSMSGALILSGWLAASYPLAQFLATPILGQLSDKYGRRLILIFSLAGTALGYFLFAYGFYTKNIPLLFVSRIIDGLTGGNLSVAQATIADVTPPKDRTKIFALIGAMFGVGFVMGPYLGARLSIPSTSFFGLFSTPSWFSVATPFLFTGILSVINMTLVYFRLPETNPNVNSTHKMSWGQSFTNIKYAFTAPGLRVLFISLFLFTAGFSFFTTFFQVLLREKLHFSLGLVGDFYAYIGIWIVLTQAVLTPILSQKLKVKPATILRYALVGQGIALLLQLVPTTTLALFMVAPLIAIFNGLIQANSISLVSRSADATMQGSVLGVNASVAALGTAIPPIIAGYVATFGIAKPVIIGGLIIVVSGIFFNLLYFRTKKDA